MFYRGVASWGLCVEIRSSRKHKSFGVQAARNPQIRPSTAPPAIPMNRLLYWLCVALWTGVLIWAGVICYFSSLSGPEIQQMLSYPLWDKLCHFIAFAIGSVLFTAALTLSTEWPATRVILVTLICLSVFGALDEWHQLYTPQRSGADMYDWLADTLGVFAGACAFRLFYVRRDSRKTAPVPSGA
jgi:VanZ family protein